MPEYYKPKKRYNMNGTGSPYKSTKDPWKLLVCRARGNAKPGHLKGNGIAREEALPLDITAQSLRETEPTVCCATTLLLLLYCHSQSLQS